MKRYINTFVYILSVHVLALLVMTLFRLIQFITLHSMMGDGDLHPLGAFFRGVWFDNVIMCYITVLPLLVLLIAASVGYSHRYLIRGANIWYAVWCAIAFIPSAANIPYFQYFFKVINSSIFGWFGYVGTTTGMVLQEKSYWLFFLLYFILTIGFIRALQWLGRCCITSIGHTHDQQPSAATPTQARNHITFIVCRLLLTIVLVSLCLFGIRGRMGYNPIKVSQAYYCDDAFLNQLGINPAFNLLTSALDDMRKENKELHLMPYAEAISLARQSLDIKGETDSMHILRRQVINDSTHAQKKHPNVVVILMESMSANLLQTFGQEQALTPTLDSLYRHSLAFTHFYSAGIHTNHGMTATLYSFPALMFRNLMKGTVTPHREGIPTVLAQNGYENMFFMSHEAQYDNMKAFFTTNGYHDIYSQENYPKEEVVNSFGVSDHFELGYALNTINEKAKTGKPFMATILTISNHPPYIIPDYFHPKTSEKETQIVEYADWAIGDFLRKASHEPWYKNTIFVIQADHGKIVGKGKSVGELPESYNHIPLIIIGPGVPEKQYTGLGMQVDVMPTLLGIMGIDYTYDGFGVNLLQKERQMVFYSADNQLVARDHQRLFIYNPKMNRSFCYEVKEDGTLVERHDEKRFSDLRQYVFSMIQSAEYIERMQ